VSKKEKTDTMNIQCSVDT